MIKLIDLLKEGKQVGVLYHGTTLSALKNIINSNKIKSSADVTSHYHTNYDFPLPTNKSTNPVESISLTRSKQYALKQYYYILELDGDKLSNNYKILPFRDLFSLANWDEWDEEDQYPPTLKLANNEFEERIYKDIFPLNKYLIKVIIKKSEFNPELESFLKEKNIPYEVV